MKTNRLNHFLAATAVAFALVISLPAQALSYSNLYLFGDSLSDTGNIAAAFGAPGGVLPGVPSADFIPGAPYMPFGVFSNGPVWASSFASALGLSALPSLAGGTDFAFGGARMAVNGAGPGGLPLSLSTQVSLFLGGTGGVAPSSALYIVAGGGNDLRDAAAALAAPGLTWAQQLAIFSGAVSRYATDTGAIVDRLQAAGASNIIVWNAPNVGLTPAALSMGPVAQGTATLLASEMNAALAYRLQGEVGVSIFDVFGFVGGIVANPGLYGLTNVSLACGFAGNGCDPATALFWDGIHPTAAAHQLLANAMIAAVVPEPQTAWLFVVGIAGLLGWRRRRAAA